MNSKMKYRSTLMCSAIALMVAGLPMASIAADADCQQTTASNDAWIDTRLETAYLFNTHLNNFTIDTDVKDGAVTLSGTVKSEIDKDLAGEIAMSLDGVEDVNNELVVSADAAPGDTADSTGDDFFQKVRDATTTAKVKTRLIANENVAASDIDVDTSANVVRLSGIVESSTLKQLAEFIARNTSGVDSVVNELEVSETQRSS